MRKVVHRTKDHEQDSGDGPAEGGNCQDFAIPLGLVDDAHSTTAELFDDAVVGNRAADNG